MLSIRRRHFLSKSDLTSAARGALTALRQNRSPVPVFAKADGAVESADPESAPARVRECVAGWQVLNGRDEICRTFSKSYDGCRLHGRRLVLCRRNLFAIEVLEFLWDDATGNFVEHRRYTDESPACGDGR